MSRVLPTLPAGRAPIDPARELAAATGQLLAQLHGEAGGDARDAPMIAAAARRAVLAVAAGHSCAQLAEPEVEPAALAESVESLPEASPPAPPVGEWIAALRRSPVVLADGEPEALRPLVLAADGRLYLQRYWRYEVELAAALRRLDQPMPGITAARAQELSSRHFAAADARTEAQRLAVETALRRGLCVVTGGPGTGKTTTVVRILAALLEHDPGLSIGLAAPTGKAAARMQEAIAAQLAELTTADAATRARLAAGKAQTLHRLLGYRFGRTSFRHGRELPLPQRVLVIDEASMLDLALAAKLLAAVGAGTRVILLGDRDQLASVEAGSVFAQLCSPQAARGDAVVRLAHSFRFDGSSGIGRLAAAVNAGDGAAAAGCFDDVAASGLQWQRAASAAPELAPRLLEGYADYFAAVRRPAAAAEALARFERFRVLCALRSGPQGTIALNAALSVAFLETSGHAGAVPRWYAGRPVIVTTNDYALRLFNGDVGVTLPDARGNLMVHFAAAGGGTRAIPAARVPACETAFALTVHKAQGSEFDRVEIVLPGRDSPLLTRELIYTAITRARRGLRLWAAPDLLAAAVSRRVVRHSGLAQRLAAPVDPVEQGSRRPG